MDIYRKLGHFLDPSSGNLISNDERFSRAVDLLGESSEEIDRLRAELDEAEKDTARLVNFIEGAAEYSDDPETRNLAWQVLKLRAAIDDASGVHHQPAFSGGEHGERVNGGKEGETAD